MACSRIVILALGAALAACGPTATLWDPGASGDDSGEDDSDDDTPDEEGSTGAAEPPPHPLVDVWAGRTARTEHAANTWVVIDIKAIAPDGTVEGTVRFGEPDEPLAPPFEDPDLPYPPGVTEPDIRVMRYAYPLDARVDESGRTVTGIYPPLHVWDEWCEAQTSYFHIGTSYEPYPWCMTGDESDDDGCYCEGRADEPRVDCEWLALAKSEVCECDASGCVAPEVELSVELALVGNQLEAEIVGLGPGTLDRQ